MPAVIDVAVKYISVDISVSSSRADEGHELNLLLRHMFA